MELLALALAWPSLTHDSHLWSELEGGRSFCNFQIDRKIEKKNVHLETLASPITSCLEAGNRPLLFSGMGALPALAWLLLSIWAVVVGGGGPSECAACLRV